MKKVLFGLLLIIPMSVQLMAMANYKTATEIVDNEAPTINIHHSGQIGEPKL